MCGKMISSGIAVTLVNTLQLLLSAQYLCHIGPINISLWMGEGLLVIASCWGREYNFLQWCNN